MYREVTMIEVREILDLRRAGVRKQRIAAQVGLDPKTVSWYLKVAATAGVSVTATISDDEVRQVCSLHRVGGRPRGDGWARCLEQRAAIARWLGDGLRLTRIRKSLLRQAIQIAYPTLHRFAVCRFHPAIRRRQLKCVETSTGLGHNRSIKHFSTRTRVRK
jgi:hypothetical protein